MNTHDAKPLGQLLQRRASRLGHVTEMRRMHPLLHSGQTRIVKDRGHKVAVPGGNNRIQLVQGLHQKAMHHIGGRFDGLVRLVRSSPGVPLLGPSACGGTPLHVCRVNLRSKQAMAVEHTDGERAAPRDDRAHGPWTVRRLDEEVQQTPPTFGRVRLRNLMREKRTQREIAHRDGAVRGLGADTGLGGDQFSASVPLLESVEPLGDPFRRHQYFPAASGGRAINGHEI